VSAGRDQRRPLPGEFRSNLAVGGEPESHPTLTTVERAICAELAPALQADGLFFVGIDVMASGSVRSNVTRPTGIRWIERLGAAARGRTLTMGGVC